MQIHAFSNAYKSVYFFQIVDAVVSEFTHHPRDHRGNSSSELALRSTENTSGQIVRLPWEFSNIPQQQNAMGKSAQYKFFLKVALLLGDNFPSLLSGFFQIGRILLLTIL